MWERACPRRRSVRRHQYRLNGPIRGQARSHRVRRRYENLRLPTKGQLNSMEWFIWANGSIA
ncbi:hypothetical protein C9422_20015 [Pseudomonas sp. B1(2018)]|nr:hypothetical protein C9422_20015 [Pseudomonas sp. B1(2018)]